MNTTSNAAQARADAIRARRQHVTEPIVVDTLADKVALVERFQPDDEWTVTANVGVGDSWVLRWDRATLTVGDLDDLELARFVAAERVRARQDLRRHVITTATALGLPARRFTAPAIPPALNTGLTRCPGCGCNVAARTHRPGSEDCRTARLDRDASRSA